MARTSTASSAEVPSGLVDRVTFHNPENGFCVLRVKARGQREPITLVGHAVMIAAGEFVKASGSWINDRTHGVQFRASFLKPTAPTTVEGIEKYLGSGMIRGIAPVYAKKLVRAFSEAVFDIIEQQPDRLREVTGIGPKRAERIVAVRAEQRVIREIMLFLHSNGVGTSRAVRIYKTYGADAIPLISQNPYCLARDIRGIGFRTADQIAAKLGIEKTALIRVRAGISFALAEAMDDGDCGLPREQLLTLTGELLEVPAELVETALGLELQDGALIADDLDGRGCVFLAGLYRAEREIAEKRPGTDRVLWAGGEEMATSSLRHLAPCPLRVGQSHRGCAGRLLAHLSALPAQADIGAWSGTGSFLTAAGGNEIRTLSPRAIDQGRAGINSQASCPSARPVACRHSRPRR
jgi:exodeoxyribonuclease V alpha subunit